MAVKKIRHAIFEWFDPDGTRHYAFRGEIVELPDHVVEAFDKFGPFDDSSADDSTDGDDLGDTDDSPADEVVAKPAKTAAVAAWRKYALWAKAHGVAGDIIGDLSDDDIAEMDRKDLIEALP